MRAGKSTAAVNIRNKIYVGMQAKFLPGGEVVPQEILWPDGRKFPIDQVLDVRPVSGLMSAYGGVRYTCRVKNRETYLFYEGNKWFMEGKRSE